MQTNLHIQADTLYRFIQIHPRLLVLTGAGVSLASGIPTYRDENGVWQRGTPLQHEDFIKKEAVRKRYWARSFVGWPSIAQAQPNAAHQALAKLEQFGVVEQLVTQNVDNLHQVAGHQQVVDLHGNLQCVVCLQCGNKTTRAEQQKRLTELNPQLASLQAEIRPDGDAALADDYFEYLQLPTCLVCEGVLMPDVVFFGGSVPVERVEACLTALKKADALLVIGSSLKVYSGYRFCVRAKAWEKPIILLNPGNTRADELAHLHIRADGGEVLTELVECFCSQPHGNCED